MSDSLRYCYCEYFKRFFKKRLDFKSISNNVRLSSLGFLSSANEVSTEPTCQKVYVCLSSVCISRVFLKASNWLIYWLLTVVLTPYFTYPTRCFELGSTNRLRRLPKNEDDLKIEDNLKNENNLKN